MKKIPVASSLGVQRVWQKRLYRLEMGGVLPGSEYEFSSMEATTGCRSDYSCANEINHELNPFFVDYSELTWLSFTATETGLASVDVEEYVIFVYDDADKIWMTDKDGNVTYEPMQVVQDAKDNSHGAVKANTMTHVAITIIALQSNFMGLRKLKKAMIVSYLFISILRLQLFL